MQLKNLDEIFQRRILRIPDYQRGYAWTTEHCEYFWEDLNNLNSTSVHYTGVITLEPVPASISSRWEEDQWILEGVGYKPFYVVDGQQRLTTIMILIQTIIEKTDPSQILLHQKMEDIRRCYILNKSSNSQLEQSYLFGYEVDNPSNEFLKTQIYGEDSSGYQHQHTLYTRNLASAKALFKQKISQLNHAQIEIIFKKLTQKIKFNLYEITDEIDVFVTFETMNNRGKKLSNLELLKNRLIYLSTLFAEDSGRNALRRKINDAWKTIYEYLGRNPDAPLNDDTFLRNHWIMYFHYTRNRGDDYIKFLLEERFHVKNITHPTGSPLTIEDIDDYVTNLQQSIRPWFYIHNPYYPLQEYKNEQNQNLLDRLRRLSFKAFRPLLLAAYVSNKPIDEINTLLIAMERYNFTAFTLSQRRANTGDSEFYLFARELLNNRLVIPKVVESINDWTRRYFDAGSFYNQIHDKYKIGRDGFYHWDGLRYFLFEYEAQLRHKGKQAVAKLTWQALHENKKDYVTVEHIYPQTPADQYWIEHFDNFSKEQTMYLTHSLGNLVPLSIAKNSSLQNDPFPFKKNNGQGVGFYNGSASENEVAQAEHWTAEQILQRGMSLLSFMEKRWDIVLGDQLFKEKLLHLDFLHMKDEVPHQHLVSETVLAEST